MNRMAGCARVWSLRLDRVVEVVCGVLVAVLVVDVWLGVVTRYLMDLGVTWTEELARYLMIWVALLAVSCGIARREHVAVVFLSDRFPRLPRRALLIAFDAMAFAFFALLGVYGVTMTAQGASQFTTLFGISMTMPYAAVPVSCALACVQLALIAVRDLGGEADLQPEAAVAVEGE